MSIEGGTLGKLHWSDIVVIGLYYAGTLAIGIYTICKTRNNLNSVFLAGRSLTWWPIGMSLFASNIGSINFVGIAGTGAASGIAVIMFEWSAVFLLVLLGWIFIPVYIASGIYTIPEYLRIRFGGQRLRVYLSIIALLTYVFAILSVDLYSGALFIQHIVGWNIYIGVAIILGTTILFTTLGGLMTVVLTDAFAVVVMVGSGFLLFILGMIEIGGFSELYTKYNAAIPNVTLPNSTCGYPREDAWHIFRDSIHADFPGLGTFLRTTFGSLWFWCSNQLIVQRSLAAKNIIHAKAGSLLTCYLKLTPMLIMVIPGMISRALFPNEVACGTPDTCEQICGNRAGCSNIAYPRLATALLPNGLCGLLVAAMLAAVISSLTSVFNSSSSIITIDIWTRIRPKAKEKEQMIVAKVFLVFLMAIAVAWIPTMENAEGGQIYRYAQSTVGLFGGPTCGLFLMAVLCTRVNERGAFWGLVVGQVWGISRFVLDVVFPAPPCGELDTRPTVLKYWHVYYHVISQIIVTAAVALLVSLCTERVPISKLAGVTFWTKYDKQAEVKPIIKGQYSGKGTKVESAELVNVKKQVPQDKTNQNDEEMKTGFNEVEESKSFTSSTWWSQLTGRGLLGGLYWLFVESTAAVLKGPDLPSRLSSLRQSTFATILLNINALLVVSITIGLYVFLR